MGRELFPAQEPGGGIKGGKREGDDPAQHELDEIVLDAQRIAAETQHVEYGRYDAYTVLKPEGNGGQDQKY